MTKPERDPNDIPEDSDEEAPEAPTDEPVAEETAESAEAESREGESAEVEPSTTEDTEGTVPEETTETAAEDEEIIPTDPTEPVPRRERLTRSRRAEAQAAAEANQLRIAFIGGTGPEGLGLAMRFARAGNMVYIGSRTEERAEEAIAKVKEIVPNGDVFGGLNREGAERADVVFVTVPADAHEATLAELADAIGEKVLVDVVVPMAFGDKDGPKAVDLDDGSAAEQARRLAPDAKVISAFHHVDGGQLQKVDKPMQGDVLVCGDHKAAKKQVMDLVEQIEWMRALDAGPLSNSRYLESWTVVLIHLNKIYKAHSGVRITGI